MTKCRKKGKERGCDGEERKKGRKGGRGGFKGEGREKERKKERKEGRKGERKEKRETKGGGKEGRKSALGERGARSTCTLYERNPRRRRWAVVHLMHAYARLSGIPCTPTLDYPEFHAHLRSNILNTKHASDRFARFFMKIANKFA